MPVSWGQKTKRWEENHCSITPYVKHFDGYGLNVQLSHEAGLWTVQVADPVLNYKVVGFAEGINLTTALVWVYQDVRRNLPEERMRAGAPPPHFHDLPPF